MVFWRKEFGNDDIEFALEKLRAARNFDRDGKVSLSVGFADYWQSYLDSAAAFDAPTDIVRHKALQRALFSSDLVADFTHKDFRAQVLKARNALLCDQKDFRVAFPVWNLPTFIPKMVKLDGANISFFPSKNTATYKQIASVRKEQRRDYDSFFDDEKRQEIESCDLVLVRVSGINSADAYERAYSALSAVLGTANLVLNYGQGWRFSSRERGKLPVSSVLIAPHSTTHHLDGSITHDGLWHDEWVGGPEPRSHSVEQLTILSKNFNVFWNAAKSSKWRRRSLDALSRYHSAFALPNLEQSFFEGWRLFEAISGGRDTPYFKRIQRGANVFEQERELRLLGNHLVTRRNLISHGHAIRRDDSEDLAFQMHRFTAPLLEKFLLNGFKFCSVEEFWEFLDVPGDPSVRRAELVKIERRRHLLECAARFRGQDT
ncbi:hypothetical protein [Thiosulfatihalobacter marinus]|uniref:hypothetical protein n=1 Tax=Thiosulfatihalobacter marinus TaxID=2792481 RepID=UPI0018D77EB4|nr:hypothetical protein [Thiosulfatihalobacter marinus]